MRKVPDSSDLTGQRWPERGPLDSGDDKSEKQKSLKVKYLLQF